jgi:hypothetical protein
MIGATPEKVLAHNRCHTRHGIYALLRTDRYQTDKSPVIVNPTPGRGGSQVPTRHKKGTVVH